MVISRVDARNICLSLSLQIDSYYLIFTRQHGTTTVWRQWIERVSEFISATIPDTLLWSTHFDMLCHQIVFCYIRPTIPSQNMQTVSTITMMHLHLTYYILAISICSKASPPKFSKRFPCNGQGTNGILVNSGGTSSWTTGEFTSVGAFCSNLTTGKRSVMINHQKYPKPLPNNHKLGILLPRPTRPH